MFSMAQKKHIFVVVKGKDHCPQGLPIDMADIEFMDYKTKELNQEGSSDVWVLNNLLPSQSTTTNQTLKH